MSEEEKFSLKRHVWKVQLISSSLAVIIVISSVWAMLREKYHDIDYAAKRTPVIERKLDSSNIAHDMAQKKNDSTLAVFVQQQKRFMNLTAHKIHLDLQQIFQNDNQ